MYQRMKVCYSPLVLEKEIQKKYFHNVHICNFKKHKNMYHNSLSLLSISWNKLLIVMHIDEANSTVLRNGKKIKPDKNLKTYLYFQDFFFFQTS